METVLYPSEIKRRLKVLGLKQKDVAVALGCDQGQVSRLLGAGTPTTSETYRQLSGFVQRQSGERHEESRAIVQAAADRCWDGTESHAVALAKILDSLAEYSAS